MSSPDPRLDLLRQDIDAIDTAIHDLIVKRGTIVEDIRKIKKRAGPALRPGREARILRRLAAKHQGAFPLPALVCLWREMMGGFTHMQQPFSGAVHAPEGSDRLTRLARDHYGSMTPLSAMSSASACVRAVVEGTVDVAILSVPSDGENESWWPLLMSSDKKTPQVISRLPFLQHKGDDQALVIAPWARDHSDCEGSLIAIRLGERASRSRIMTAMTAAGFADPVSLSTMEIDPENCFHVVEVAGSILPDDPLMAALPAKLGPALMDAHVIGGYARPLVISRKTGKN
jgi:chorismate mutase/prephenate dehydratase